METRTEFESGSMAEFFGAVHDAGIETGKMEMAEQTRVTMHEFEGRKYIKEGTKDMREVKAPRTTLRLSTFGSVADFAAAVKKYAKKPAVVMVNKGGANCYLNPECLPDEDDTIHFAPFVASLPTTEPLTYAGFQELLDMFAGAVREEKDLRVALKVMKATKTSAMRFEDRGAYTHVSMEAGVNVVAGEMDVPKVLQFTVPYGDPSYTMPLLYRLQIQVKGDGLAFDLTAMQHVDKRDEQFVVQAIADLREALKDTPHEVYRAA